MSEALLIVNADDFGLAPSVNAAIIAGHRAGNVTSATMMAAMPGAEDAAKLASEHPRLGVGLHFCLTEGKPLSRCPSLVDSAGRFLPWSRLMLRASAGRVAAEDVRRELGAQWARIEALGVRPDHIDSHQHAHMHPSLLRTVVEGAEARRVPVRLVSPPRAGHGAGALKTLKQALLRAVSGRFRARGGFKSNDRLVAVHDTAGMPPSSETYRMLVQAGLPCGAVELMVHLYPRDAEDLRALYPEDFERRAPFFRTSADETSVLTGSPIFSGVAGLRTGTYGEL